MYRELSQKNKEHYAGFSAQIHKVSLKYYKFGLFIIFLCTENYTKKTGFFKEQNACFSAQIRRVSLTKNLVSATRGIQKLENVIYPIIFVDPS